MREVFAIFHNTQLTSGILKRIAAQDNSNDISLSSVEKGIYLIKMNILNIVEITKNIGSGLKIETKIVFKAL